MFDWTVWDNFHFLRPWWLLGLVIWLVVALLQWRRQKTQSRWEGIIHPSLLKFLLVPGSSTRRITPASVGVMGGVLAILAAAGPSWRQEQSELFNDEAALVILLDVSPSMETTDVQPSRLQRAKQKIGDLLELRGGAPTALVAYAGTAHTVIPLTKDPAIVHHLLPAISPRIMPVPGKSAAQTLPVVENLLAGRTAPGTVLLLTDSVAPADEAAFQGFFNSRDDQLLVWGIGTEDAELEVPLARGALETLARACGGHYQTLTLNDSDARRIDQRTTRHLVAAMNSFAPWVDDGYLLVPPIALLILLWFRRGWSISWE
jgi:Ca-activated chloride channel family protein